MSTNARILQTLLNAAGDYVSGQALAETLKISRVAVWNRLQKLQDSGIAIESIRNRGHRILSEPLHYQPDLLEAWRRYSKFPYQIHFHPTIDSTNSEAQRLLSAGEPTPFIVLASEQTQGRGRRGRNWHSPSEGNFYASFAVRPDLPPSRMQAITVWFGLQLCLRLRQITSLPIQIKWPNDLILNGRKICGMLTESKVDADGTRELVYGVGINLFASCTDYPADIRQSAASLFTERPGISLHELTLQIFHCILDAWETFLIGHYKADLIQNWSSCDALKDREIRADHGGKEIYGIASGITEEGHLILLLPNGTRQHLNAGEVSIGSSQLNR